MNRYKLIVFLLAAVFCACTHVPEREVVVHECAAPAEGRACAMCFASGSTAYVVSGRLQSGHYTSSMLCYDATTDQWAEVATPLTARVNGTACATSQGVFMGLGYQEGHIYTDTCYLHDWWHFAPATGTWTKLADYPSDKVVAAVCWSDNAHVWVACGFHRAFTNEVYRYDIATDSWTKVKDSPIRVQSAIATTCQGRHFLGTGFRKTGQNAWWEFIDDAHYAQRMSVPGPGRHNATCAATDKAVWAMGGMHFGDTLTTGFFFDDLLRYSPEDNQWALCGTLPCGTMENGAACAIGNRLYFGLGEDKHGKLHLHWYSLDD